MDASKRVVIIEDDRPVATVIEEFLQDFGFLTVSSSWANLSFFKLETFDAALFDIDLHLATSAAIIIARLKIPFFLMSDYGIEILPNIYHNWKCCKKPFRFNVLNQFLKSII